MHWKSICVCMWLTPRCACWCAHACARVYPRDSLCLWVLRVIVMGAWLLWSRQQHGKTDYLSAPRRQRGTLGLMNLTSKFNILLISQTNSGPQQVVSGGGMNLFENIMHSTLRIFVILFHFRKTRVHGSALHWTPPGVLLKRLNHYTRFSREKIKMGPWTIDTARGLLDGRL